MKGQSARREDPISERRDDRSESEISSDESDDDFNPNESVTTEEQQALALKSG